MVIVDIAGMDGPCSNILSFCGSGGVFRRHRLIFEALGFIFDVLLVPGWPNGREWPQVSKKGTFFYEKLAFFGLLLGLHFC